MDRARALLTAPHFVPDLCASEVTWLGLRLYRSFKSSTLDALGLEEYCGDMLASVAGMPPTSETGTPAWLARAVDLLRACFRDSLTLEAIAQQVGVHPIHLSRVFRRRHRCSLAEYQHRLRVQYVCRALESGWADLAALAVEAGFADQSHMGRVFKSCTGQTPAQFRKFFHLDSPSV
jgi:AraC family transcriptional regulator